MQEDIPQNRADLFLSDMHVMVAMIHRYKGVPIERKENGEE